MRNFHKITINYHKTDKTCFFFKLPLILPICKLAIKRDMFFVSNTEYKI